MQQKKPAAGRRTKATMRRGRRRVSQIQGKNILLVASCILLPPLGFFLVWRCDWRVRYKYVAFAAMAVLMIGVLVLTPWSRPEPEGGVTMVEREPQMEIYGPELPPDLVEGYEPRPGESALSDDQSTPKPSEYVYAAVGSKFYHTYTCRYAYDSAQKLTPYEAYYLGYQPCSACNPPKYQPGTIPD